LRRRTPGNNDGICKRPLFHGLKCHFETIAANTAGTLRQYDDNNSRHDPNTIRICRLRLAPVSGISA
jgi:hypothetical protein